MWPPERSRNLTPYFACQSEFQFEILEAELAHIDVLLQRAVQRWSRAGQNLADEFRGLYVADAEAKSLLERPIGANWGSGIGLTSAEEQTFGDVWARAKQAGTSLRQSLQEQGELSRLDHLATAFDLDAFDTDALLICLAPSLDLRYERIYGYLQDDVTRRRPTINLVLDLLVAPGIARLAWLSHFSDDAPLFKHDLLERGREADSAKPPLLRQALTVDETVLAWLLRGDYQPHSDIAAHLHFALAQENATNALLGAEMVPHLERIIGECPILVLTGPDQVRQTRAARLLAARLKRPLLTVDLAAAVAANIDLPHILRLALRDARLTTALPYFTGWDACLVNGSAQPALLSALWAYTDLVIVAGEKTWQATGVERTRTLFQLPFPAPTYTQRCAFWTHFLSSDVPEDALAIQSVAGQFVLTAGQIRDTVATARDLAAQRGSPLQNADLFAAARAQSNPNLANLARKIVPRYGWQDIILPKDQLALLREIVITVRGRPVVLEAWGVGRKLVASEGVTVLFAGPSGTGKTMAAEIIASELGLDLYKIDLSTVVSKYIGETEKNLERIFVEAERSNAILFFDEADALFGKRSEVRDSHDRYANIEISYLLQRMEAYNGVTILATNLRANLDEAFTRRLQFAVDFPFPEEQDRLRIWQTLFPPEVPCEPNLDFALFAKRFKLAGGSIRNIIVSAVYLAANNGQCVTQQTLLHSTRRELQKMGRLMDEADFFSD